MSLLYPLRNCMEYLIMTVSSFQRFVHALANYHIVESDWMKEESLLFVMYESRDNPL